MQQRIDVTKVSPAVYQAAAALQTYVDQSGLDARGAQARQHLLAGIVLLTLIALLTFAPLTHGRFT